MALYEMVTYAKDKTNYGICLLLVIQSTDIAVMQCVFKRETKKLVGVLDQYKATGTSAGHWDLYRMDSMVKTAEYLIAYGAHSIAEKLDKLLPSSSQKKWLCAKDQIQWRIHGLTADDLIGLCRAHDIKIHHAPRALEQAKGIYELLKKSRYFEELINGDLMKQTTLQRIVIDQSLHALEGILRGISIDRTINDIEIRELRNWCGAHYPFLPVQPFQEIIPLLDQTLSDQELTDDEIADLLWLIDRFKTDNRYHDVVTSDIQRLHGMLYGILSDGCISDDEIRELKHWIDENTHLAKTYPYSELNMLLHTILKDQRIDEHERSQLMVYFNEYLGGNLPAAVDMEKLNELKASITIGGIFSIHPEIVFEGKLFCITGESARTSRYEMQQQIESRNGTYQNAISPSIDYLIVGSKGNPLWAFSCYGRKIEKAMEFRMSGKEILIVHEDDFWDALNENPASA